MNIDIERLKHDREYWDEVAPEGATHYGPNSETHREAWFKGVDESQSCMALIPGYADDQWHSCMTARADRIPRPAKQWSGPEDGVPPVGTECECNVNAVIGPGSWFRGKVVANEVEDGRYVAVFVYRNEHNSPRSVIWDAPMFRPLKSEKDRVVEAAMGVCREMLFNESYAKQYAEALYDAGALKMPEGE
ncbi:MAG: hypothetical protein ACPH3N_00940 [Alcanivorax sediminis]|uniref:hypothetical protein n=1 Tax=Alcanivorax sediminis TaxID=2663008 RepID=UPI003C55C0B0